MEKLDFLAIGDIVIDAFIKLKDAHVHCKIDTDTCELCVRFGDKVPYEEVTILSAVGNSPNASVSASRLGLKTGLISHIGNDQYGQDCLEALKKNNVSTEYIITENGKKTNYHYVLWYDVDRTILIKHTDFNYKLPKLPEISWIYLSSLSSNSLEYHKEISEFLEKNPETKLAFQPGTFQISLGVEKLKKIYEHTEIFFCNIEEAEKITQTQDKNPLSLSQKIKSFGPKIVALSDGPNGSYLFYQDELWHLPIFPDTSPAIDRTGAGDAFASTITSAIALGLSPLEAFLWGPINSMSVVQKIGAQEGLLTKEKIENLIKNAPENYKPQKIN